MAGDGAMEERSRNHRSARRSFLKAGAAIPLGLAAAKALAGKGAGLAGAATEASPMPTVALGKHRISRLISGGNPINGGSHLSRFVDRSMREYFTAERIQEYLGRCARAGINTWQSSGNNHQHWQKFRKSGESLNYIALAHASTRSPSVAQAARMGFLGIAHHGEVTDRLFKTGKIDQVREFLKKVRDAGLCVGLSTHMPAVVDYVETKGWDLDFYMTCVYERHRSREELLKILGHVPIRVGEVYLEDDPLRMYKAIRSTRRTCLAFKILAAGRLCQSPSQVEQAFETTFKNIKPTDAVILGMFPRWTDQIREDAALVRRFGNGKRATRQG